MNHEQKGRRGMFAAAVLGAVLLAGCEVTNPGPVSDDNLTIPAAQQGFVDGAKERLTEAYGEGAYFTAFIARELFPGGTIGSYGQDVEVQAGSMDWNESGNNNLYPHLQQARWIAEEAVRRLEKAEADPELIAQAYVYAGYANRMLGENYCEAVIDGGPLQPGSVYFERADSEFTKAIALAPATETGEKFKAAAYAGRAQVRVWLEDWAGAMADAGQITDLTWSFDQPMDYQTGANADQRNHLWFGAASKPYRSYTVKFTGFDTYYDQTGDPRTPYIKYTGADTLCVGSLQGFGSVPCLRPWKYKTENDPMRLASGREMRLIEAEALLNIGGGDIPGAMAKITQVRQSIISDKTDLPLDPWPAPANMADAYTLLMRERKIELWQEMRRMGDQRRWDENDAPGDYELPDYETMLGAKAQLFRDYLRGRPVKVDGSPQDTPRQLCLNISDTERNSNPNIPDHNG